MKIPKWFEYQETPFGYGRQLEGAEKLALLKKLGLDASSERKRADFLSSRRLKG